MEASLPVGYQFWVKNRDPLWKLNRYTEKIYCVFVCLSHSFLWCTLYWPLFHQGLYRKQLEPWHVSKKSFSTEITWEQNLSFRFFCVTQQLFLCLFTERYFSGKKNPNTVFCSRTVKQRWLCSSWALPWSSSVPLSHLCPLGSAIALAAASLEQHTCAGHLAFSSQAWKKPGVFLTLEEGHKPEFACLL